MKLDAAPLSEPIAGHCHGCRKLTLLGERTGPWMCGRCGFENADTHELFAVPGTTHTLRCRDCEENI